MNAINYPATAVLLGLLILSGCAKPTRTVVKETQPVEAMLVEEVRLPPPPEYALAAEMHAPAYAPPVQTTIASATNVRPSGMPPLPRGTEKFPGKDANRLMLVAEQPVSTFSADVDTASYAFVRRQLLQGRMPPADAVRVEEMVNYFPYEYAAPASRSQPFGVTTELMPTPWNADTRLVHIGVRGFDIEQAERPRANVVLLIDTSGSMGPEDRLPLLKQGFRLFAAQLRDDDRVAIVTYADGTRTVLEPTAGKDRQRIIAAIDSLGSGGGTAGGEGLERAYAMAERHFDSKAVNRVILATDGDFNIGISDPRQLEQFIVKKRKTGIYLSIFGVGEGNLNDALIQRLSQSGNGNAAYIDSLAEARKAMSQELGSTMFPIANDLKLQVEFNPAQVAAYRLVGYETRMLARQDFKDDKVDAGDMGAGHSVTAIYEITPASQAGKLADPLRYAQATPATVRKAVAKAGRGANGELCFVKLRYKLPGESASRLTEHAVYAASARTSMASVPEDQRFAVAVAAFAQRLRNEKEVSGLSYADIARLASSARGADPHGYRAEFVRMVRATELLDPAGAVAQH